MTKYHLSSIEQQNELLGIRPPEHPLIDVIKLSSDQADNELSCQDELCVSAEFYSISIKHITAGEIHYGRTKYDCRNGTMMFMAPNQEVRSQGLRVKATARTICLHPDYVRGHALKEQLESYSFFNYAVNEALHLSPKEQRQIEQIFDTIEAEYQNNQDAFTKQLILTQISTLLQYADRYYHRQFLQRKESGGSSVVERFQKTLTQRLDAIGDQEETIPEVEELASAMGMTSRYLSDALKAETGKTTKDWIHSALIDRSKDLLLSTDKSVAEIAYGLGFEYPQYFSRLFKNKVGLTPTEYRNQQQFH